MVFSPSTLLGVEMTNSENTQSSTFVLTEVDKCKDLSKYNVQARETMNNLTPGNTINRIRLARYSELHFMKRQGTLSFKDKAEKLYLKRYFYQLWSKAA